MMGRRGKDDIDEEGLWALVTAEITPLKGKKAPAKADAPAGRIATKTVEKASTPRRAVVVTESAGPRARDLDRRTEQRLERGQMEIDATIDLHGYGQGAAREALLHFLKIAYQRGYRCVLAITGKGKQGSGILRARLPEWVDEPPLNGFVLRATRARQADGGEGAFYILLRRRRE